MPPTPDLYGPPTPCLSSLQRELEVRKRRYQESILRGLFVTHDGWKSAWTDQDEVPFQATGESSSVCDVLRYQKPKLPTGGDISRYPITPKRTLDSVFARIARLEVAARHPERQKEIFGWETPARKDFAGQTAFEAAKAEYWRGPQPDVPPATASLGESMEELYTLQDTADFHANYLLRLLYLYGVTPHHLRAQGAPWRTIGRFGRDINFSVHTEAGIRANLLDFKYWMDEPYYADDDGGAALRQWRATRAAQQKKLDPKKSAPASSDDDSYKTEMTFWSENHQVLFATAEYLAGQLWPGKIFRPGNHFRKEGKDKTRPSDVLGSQRMERAKPRLLRWLGDRLRFGFSEWNSPGYYDEDVTALLNLADFCLDDEIQTRACMVLDLLIFDLARFTHRGSFGVTAGRCYFEAKNCGYQQSVGDLIELLFGTRDGIYLEDSSNTAGAFASTRRYKVPDVLVAIGQDKDAKFIDRTRASINLGEASDYNLGYESDADIFFWWSRNGYFPKQVIAASLKRAVSYHLMKTSPFVDVFPKLVGIASIGTVLEHGLTLGIDQTTSDENLAKLADAGSVVTEGAVLSRANLYTYRSPDVTLSSVQNFHPGQISFQIQCCQATLSPSASVWTTYPAADDMLKLSGKHDGPNWWTGSVVAPRVIQKNNAAIIGYKPKDFQLVLFGHRTHAWFPKAAFDEGSVIQRSANCNRDESLWTFGKAGDGYVGLFSAQKPEWTTGGPWADKELLAAGARNFFILQVGSAAEFGSYGKFVDQVSGARVHVAGVPLVTAGELAGAGAGFLAGAAGGAEVAGIPGAIVGGIGGAIFGAKHAAKDFECSYDIPNGGRLELHYDDNEVRYNGRQLIDDGYPRFDNPYVKCGPVYWQQPFYTIQHGGHSLTHDYRGIDDPETPSAAVRILDASAKLEYDCSLGPRPFYVVGHNPNSIGDVVAALEHGANAIEPDVNVYEDHQNDLCISETGVIDTDDGGDSDAPSLGQYLDDLHRVAHDWPQLSLIVFDCKPKVATAALGQTLLDEIRARLTYDNNLNVIISVGSLAEFEIFGSIRSQLREREGCMVDEENSPVGVSAAFKSWGIDHGCYGNGNKFQNPVTSPNLRPSIEEACGIRAGRDGFKFIYEWTNNDDDRMREFIRTGVDGIISDDISTLLGVSQETEFQSVIRYATRDDNPFAPVNANYELAVHTGDVHMGGTDANVTFTVKGSKGKATKVIDTSLDGRMERDDWNYVTIQSPDIGRPISITVQRDDEGNGPDWYLDRILVRSFRYGVSAQAVFNRWIDTTSPYTQILA